MDFTFLRASLCLCSTCAKASGLGLGLKLKECWPKRKRKTRPITCPHSPDLKKPGWRRELSTRENPDWILHRTRKLRGTVPRSSDAPARAPLLPRHVGSGAGPPARRNKSLEEKRQNRPPADHLPRRERRSCCWSQRWGRGRRGGRELGKGDRWCLGVGKLAPDVGDNSPELGVAISRKRMLLKVFGMCESDLATELQLFFPSPFNLPVHTRRS